mmetsp:Transcript_1886/g.5503  ORF Transcript_1886/g.5503 Transcript_1886/m.5503 type:complete len:227 (+) Transcript_1886:341-1021(+)
MPQKMTSNHLLLPPSPQSACISSTWPSVPWPRSPSSESFSIPNGAAIPSPSPRPKARRACSPFTWPAATGPPPPWSTCSCFTILRPWMSRMTPARPPCSMPRSPPTRSRRAVIRWRSWPHSSGPRDIRPSLPWSRSRPEEIWNGSWRRWTPSINWSSREQRRERRRSFRRLASSRRPIWSSYEKRFSRLTSSMRPIRSSYKSSFSRQRRTTVGFAKRWSCSVVEWN